MKERIFNIFLFCRDSDQVIESLGVMVHKRDGSDRQKLRFLQERVEQDYRICKRFPLPEWCLTIEADGKLHHARLTITGFFGLYPGNRHMHVLEEMFAALNAPRDPIMCITPVADGKVRIEKSMDLKPGYPLPL